MDDNICIECKTSVDNKKYSWEAILKSFINHNDYYEAVIEARGSSIHMLVGRSDSFNWLALPFLDVSTTLSSFDDIFWNEEKLSLLINPIDSLGIVYTSAFIEKYKDLFFDKTLVKNKKFKEIGINVYAFMPRNT
ncbi:hypothetical protein [Thomasclavelia spiroformis]|uniref:hypothetical protein n=1 Tax=Thomasclavelia spiroformis TaxID=29348 RepID=UPI00241C65D3|nr:hypothetical protein [Thomasclavelia spiroformis]